MRHAVSGQRARPGGGGCAQRQRALPVGRGAACWTSCGPRAQGLGDIPADELAAPQPVTLNRLLDRLRDGYGLLYLVAHGILVDGEPQVLLEDEEGAGRWVSGVDLAARIGELRDQQRPRLVVLVSCQSAGTGEAEPTGQDDGALAGLGPRLAAAGVPAVVAMQGNLLMSTAAAFMPAFLPRAAPRRAGRPRDGRRPRRRARAAGLVDAGAVYTVGRWRVSGRPQPDTLLNLPRQPFEPETVYIPRRVVPDGQPPGDGVPTRDSATSGDAARLSHWQVSRDQPEYASFLRDHKDQPAPQGWFNREPPAG